MWKGYRVNWLNRFTARCTERQTASERRGHAAAACVSCAALLLGGCGSIDLRWPGGSARQPAEGAPVARPGPAASPSTPSPKPAVAPPQVGKTAAPRGPQPLARNWESWQIMAGQRLVDANPQQTYTGAVSEPLLAIPVLEIELNGDGSVRRVEVKRRPSQAFDTVQLAIDAVHRAAPFPPVAQLPRPWKYVEVFLFDEDRRFKPRSLD